MKVVITDANIFMHLIDADLLASFFKLDLEIVTTREVFDETGSENHLLGPYVDFQLSVVISSDDQIDGILQLPY